MSRTANDPRPPNDLHADEPNRYLVEAADAALGVLQIVAAKPDMRLSDIAADAGLNTSRVLRLLATLEHRGFVTRDADGRYRLGLQALVIGRHAEAQIDLVRIVQPYLDRLRDLTTESAQFRIRSGLANMCVAKADSPHHMRVHSVVGRNQSLNVGSSKVILAYGDPALTDEVIAAGLPHYTDRTIVDPAALRAEIEATRARGYSVSKGERIVGAVSLGAPVFGRDGVLVGVISLLGPETRIDPMLDTCIRQLVETAAALSRELGGVDARAIAPGENE
jgi:IclR family transcriptional regulator, KDG regulon repressor